VRRNVPAGRANTLRARGGAVLHGFIPLVEPTIGVVGVVGGHTVGEGVVVAPLFDGTVVGLGGDVCNHCSYAEVLLHPALGADLDGVVDIAVGVGDGGDPAGEGIYIPQRSRCCRRAANIGSIGSIEQPSHYC